MPKGDKKLFFGWIIAFTSLAVTTTAFGVLYSFGVFFKHWLHDWGCGRSTLSGAFSLAFLMYGIFSFLMGNLTDRYGPRKTLAVGGFIMGLGAFLTAFVTKAWPLYLTFGLMIGLGVGTSYSPTAATVSRWFIAKKGTAVGIVVAGLGLGTLVYPPLAKVLISMLGWRMTIMVFGIMIWGVYFAGALILRRDPKDLGLKPYGEPLSKATVEKTSKPVDRQDAPNQVPSVKTINTKEAVKTRGFWVLFSVHCFWVLGLTIPMVHLVPYATDTGITAGEASSMLAALGGLSVLGRVALGTVGSRIGLKNALICLLFFQALTMLWLTQSHNAWTIWIFCLLFGFSYGGVASIFPLVTADYFGLFAMGSIFGLIVLGATLGGVIGPWLAGYFFDLTNSYSLGFLSGAGSMLLSVLVTLAFRQKNEFEVAHFS